MYRNVFVLTSHALTTGTRKITAQKRLSARSFSAILSVSAILTWSFSVALLEQFLFPVFAQAQTQEKGFQFENDAVSISGTSCEKVLFGNGATSYSNRVYIFQNVPEEMKDVFFTRYGGGVEGRVVVTAKRDTVLHILTEKRESELLPEGWELKNERFCTYSDSGNCPMRLYTYKIKKGETIEIPQVNWTGSQLLFSDQPLDEKFPGLKALNPPPKVHIAQIMNFNHPGLICDLSAGIWSWPVLQDGNDDGLLDITISNPDTPYGGTYYFENRGIDAQNPGFCSAPGSSDLIPCDFMPVFKAQKRLGDGLWNIQATYGADDSSRVFGQGYEYNNFAKKGLRDRKELPNLPAGVGGGYWKLVDFNGDGTLDLIVSSMDWTPYGWADAYDENGVWKNETIDGAIRIYLNRGTNDEPKYDPAFRLADCDGGQIRPFGWPCACFEDFDGDGDLDMICGEYIDRFTYYENVGSRTEPKYTPGAYLTREDGDFVHMDLQMGTPLVFDWNKDGKPDLLASEEDTRLGFHENTGNFRKIQVGNHLVNTPVFREQRYFQQEASVLNGGSLVTPCGCDLNGDGATDLVCGNAAGYVLFFENLSEPGVEYPKWARPVYLKAGERTARILAGPNGSIQGPVEAKWGYTTLTVADWDGDGLLDIMLSSILGKVVWMKNIGTKTEPKFAEMVPVEVEWEGTQPRLAWGWMTPDGKKLLTQWRTTPVMFDWNQDGLMDLNMLDQEGYFVFFERFRAEDGSLKLKAPQRIFCDQNGNPLRFSAGTAGSSGRVKICFADLNRDGKPDIVRCSMNADVLFYEGEKDGKFLFRHRGSLDETRLAGHTTSPTSVDFNQDGLQEIVIGAEDGHFYYYNRFMWER